MPKRFNRDTASQRRRLFTGRTMGRLTFVDAAAAKPGAQPVTGDFSATPAADPANPILKGYPIVWNQISSDRGGYRVKLAPYSAVFSPQVLSFWNHNTDMPLAGTVNGTLSIMPPDDVGVPIQIVLDQDTGIGKDVATWVKTQICNGMSFDMANGFEDFDEAEEGGLYVVTVKKYTVTEVSPTAIPSFDSTTLQVMEDDDDPDPANEGAPPEYAAAAADARLQLARLQLAHFRALEVN